MTSLRQMIDALSPDIRHQVIRAFAIYFQLVNIAEQNHRIRRKRDYERSAGESGAARLDRERRSGSEGAGHCRRRSANR